MILEISFIICAGATIITIYCYRHNITKFPSRYPSQCITDNQMYYGITDNQIYDNQMYYDISPPPPYQQNNETESTPS
jgi:hypothetical protein